MVQVRNLCYMVSRREKLRNQLNQAKLELFLRQSAILQCASAGKMGPREYRSVTTAHLADTSIYDNPAAILRTAQFIESMAESIDRGDQVIVPVLQKVKIFRSLSTSPAKSSPVGWQLMTPVVSSGPACAMPLCSARATPASCARATLASSARSTPASTPRATAPTENPYARPTYQSFLSMLKSRRRSSQGDGRQKSRGSSTKVCSIDSLATQKPRRGRRPKSDPAVQDGLPNVDSAVMEFNVVPSVSSDTNDDSQRPVGSKTTVLVSGIESSSSVAVTDSVATDSGEVIHPTKSIFEHLTTSDDLNRYVEKEPVTKLSKQEYIGSTLVLDPIICDSPTRCEETAPEQQEDRLNFVDGFVKWNGFSPISRRSSYINGTLPAARHAAPAPVENPWSEIPDDRDPCADVAQSAMVLKPSRQAVETESLIKPLVEEELDPSRPWVADRISNIGVSLEIPSTSVNTEVSSAHIVVDNPPIQTGSDRGCPSPVNCPKQRMLPRRLPLAGVDKLPTGAVRNCRSTERPSMISRRKNGISLAVNQSTLDAFVRRTTRNDQSINQLPLNGTDCVARVPGNGISVNDDFGPNLRTSALRMTDASSSTSSASLGSPRALRALKRKRTDDQIDIVNEDDVPWHGSPLSRKRFRAVAAAINDICATSNGSKLSGVHSATTLNKVTVAVSDCELNGSVCSNSTSDMNGVDESCESLFGRRYGGRRSCTLNS